MSESTRALVLFGITGDLARKQLFSALYALTADGKLDMPIVGVASSEWTIDELRQHARTSIEKGGDVIDEDVFEELASNLSYVSGDYRDPDTFSRIASNLGDTECAVAYLAIPPGLFDEVVTGLAGVGLNENGRVILEKPFGRDLASATELNEIVHRHYPEERVYRIDHFLGKEAVQNLMVFRFSNTILEPVWNRHYIKGVQITLAEEFGVERRGPFYDSVGAIRDVVQNHLIQVLTVLAMEPPVSEDADSLRDERVKVLKAIRSLTPDDVVRGQYDGYRDDLGVARDSNTETFAAVRLEVGSWRWAGVPWVLRAGKGMKSTVTEAVVDFVRPPRPLFTGAHHRPGPNRLTFRTKPDVEINLSLQARRPGPKMISGPIELHLQHDRRPGRDPYDRLLDDALRGEQSLFAREDEVMEAWRVVNDVVDHPEQPDPYQMGSWGPSRADSLLGEDWSWGTT